MGFMRQLSFIVLVRSIFSLASVCAMNLVELMLHGMLSGSIATGHVDCSVSALITEG